MHKVLSFFLAVLCLVGAGCHREPPQQVGTKPVLLVSIPPYQTLVQELAGDSFEVCTVAPPNADPHCYEPTARQIANLLGSEVWFRIGEPFEHKVLPLLKQTDVLDLRESIEVVDHDRHLWLSPKHMVAQAHNIAAALSKRYPDKRHAIELRLAALESKLDALDADVRECLQSAKSRSFLVAHSAFGYFCRDYKCEQLSLEHEGKEARTQDLEALVTQIKASRPSVAIALPQHNNKGAQMLADQLRIPVHVVDPYDADYPRTIRTLAGLIANPYQSP